MEAILTVVLEKASEHLITTLGQELALIKNAPNELEKLERLRTVIINVQQDAVAQDLSQQHALDDWLNEMMDAAYDAEDTIDLFNIDILRRRRSKNDNKRTARITHRVNDFFSFISNPLIFRHKIGSRVKTTFGRLATIVKEKGYHLSLLLPLPLPQETFSYMGEDVVLGREYDMKTIIEHLFKVHTDTKVVVLVGMGGVGKTALAKLVYNDSHANALFGEKNLWVYVSKYLNLHQILKLIIEQIDSKPCQLKGLQPLTTKLIELLKENMYLLVLDDVSTDGSLNRDFWSKMKSLFHNCKILVTTREEKVTSMIPKSYMHRVGCLPEDVCWSLFENMAFPFPDGIVREEFKEIGKRIVNKCKGVPLAVRVLGSMMHTKQDVTDWLEVEKSNIFDTNYIDIEGQNEIFGILKFSYNNLPLKSRSCFLYCSIFTKHSFMRKMDLLQQWTSNGFIHPNEANEIFMDLLSRCFFQDVEKDEHGNIYSCKMHDLIYDLAQSIAKCQYGILDNSNYQDGFLSDRKNIRYLSIDMGVETSYSDVPIKLENLQKLRTLQSFSPQIMNKQFLLDCFTKLKFIRVLNCSGANIHVVPSSIDNLKLLKYVDFSWTNKNNCLNRCATFRIYRRLNSTSAMILLFCQKS